MATIQLYKSKINNMSNYINQVKSAVGDFCVDLSALKSKVLGINSSVCDSVVTSISTSSQTQEQQIAGLEATQREVDEFIKLTVNRDNSASSEISRAKKDFYKQYSYLKPESEKSKWEKFCDGLKKVGEWCKDHWKEIVVVLEIVAAVVCLCVPGLQGIGTGILIGMLKGVLSGAIIGGLASWAAGGSIWEGIYQGAVGGAMFGGLFGAFGAAGSMFGATSSHMCQLLSGFEKIASVTGKLSMGLMSFDIASLGLQVLKKSTGYSNPLFDAIVATNNKCHSSTLYNITQTALALTAVTTGSAAKSARATGNTCFIAGTMVLTASGLIAIENVKIGDKVISADIETGDASEKTVLETYLRKVDKLIHLVINGEEIVTTEDHPFYVQGRGFIEAGRLFIGDKLISVNGDDLIVDEIKIEQCENPVNVYNFQVEEYHTYFVGENEVWVHNADCTIEFQNKSGYDEREFKEQLETQQERLNKMTVEEYQNKRASYQKNGRASDSVKYQQSARQETISDRIASNIKNNMSYEEAYKEAVSWAEGKAALHGLDQIAGGRANDITGLGDAKINSSIGSQWKAKSRIGILDDYVAELSTKLTPEEMSKTYLDIELVLK